MFTAILSRDAEWASKMGERILSQCVPLGRYVALKLFECPEKLLRHLNTHGCGTVIMSIDHMDDLDYARDISETGARLILLTDSNDIAIKAYSVCPHYCALKHPDAEDFERISSIIFCE